MKTWHKWLLGLAGVIVITLLVLGIFVYRYLHTTLPDMYAQWGAAELVIAFKKDKGKMPESWDDMKAYDPRARHSIGLSFDEVKSRIIMDFDSLRLLEINYSDPNSIPEVIRTKSGIQSHWAGAEPNQFVHY